MKSITKFNRISSAGLAVLATIAFTFAGQAAAVTGNNNLDPLSEGGSRAGTGPERDSFARVQVIHNAADPAAAAVDIYIDQALAIDDFAFRAATPYLDLPAEVEFSIGVAPGNSTGPGDIIASFPVTLAADESYVVFANGVLDPMSFEPNPEGRDTAFTLFVKAGAQESGMAPDMVDFFALHGATDAPTVSVNARDVGTLASLTYGDISDYLSVPAADYILDLTTGSDNDAVVASFAADLSGLGGGAGVVFASGFLNPGQGEAFGLFVALPDGTVLELPALTTSRVQVIHNAADPAAEMVDIYIDQGLALDNFAFRMATPYIDLPGNSPFEIGVAPANSSGPGDIIASFPVQLLAAETYVVIANGVLDPVSFEPNPDGRDTAFTLFVKEGAREAARETVTDPNYLDLFILHGATDAPTVDVITTQLVELVDDAAYGDMTDYIFVPAMVHLLAVTDADRTTVVKRFRADLSGLGGGAAVVFASGFLNPGQGEAFTLLAALPDGTVIDLALDGKIDFVGPLLEGQGDPLGGGSIGLAGAASGFSGSVASPNPFSAATRIAFALPAEEVVQLRVQDVTGRTIAKLIDGKLSAGTHVVDFDGSRLPNGLYFYRLSGESFNETRKLVLSR